MNYPNKVITPIFALSILIIMGITIYLNQEVPACIDNPIVRSTVQLNYSHTDIDKVNTQLSNVSISEINVVIFETNGSSMEPLIYSGERCACVKSSNYSVGDIVVFFGNFGQGFEGIMHPIVSISENNIITKGINNNFSDQPIVKENILCKIPMVKKYELFKI